jgi:uncharacterized membrane protein YeaQ/YmgE (transglycosylase-associated protein family)
MNLIIWLVVGALMGGAACFMRRTDAPPPVVTNVVVGVMGALVGGWFLSPLVGGSTTDQVDFSGVALMVSLAGATLFLTISNLAHREMSR